MQVTSTLWPDIKSQKLSKPSLDKSRQAKTNMDQTRRPRTACWKKMGAVGATGRPADLPGRPTGPWAPPP